MQKSRFLSATFSYFWSILKYDICYNNYRNVLINQKEKEGYRMTILKKSMIFGLCVLSALSICACTTKKEEMEPQQEMEEVPVQEPTAVWANYALTVNGEELTLPCSYERLQSLTNCTVDNSVSMIEKEEDITLYDENGLVLGVAKFYDMKDNKQRYDKCDIVALTQTYKTEGMKFEYAGGLKVGDEITQDELIGLFGEPDDISDGILDEEMLENMGSHYQHQWKFAYHAKEPYLDNTFEIKVFGGRIYSIVLNRIGLYTADVE